MSKKIRVTIKDVAKAANVSVATVSYVFNDVDSVGAETRARVLRVAQDLGYRPSALAKNLQSQRSHTLAYCWRRAEPDRWHPVMDRFLAGLMECAKELGYYVLTFPDHYLQADLKLYDELLLSGRVDGFIISNTIADDLRLRHLAERDFPFVSFGRSAVDVDFAYVDIDDEDGAAQVVQHFVANGHRRIGMVAWQLESTYAGHYREQGYKRVLAESGIALDPDLIIKVENEENAARNATAQLMALPEEKRPTAIFAVSDLMAIGVLNALHDLGVQPGCDVAVAGYDDIPTAQYFRPTLTTVRMPVYQTGEAAVSMLVKLINGEPLESRQVLFKPKLIVRKSSESQ